MKEGWQSSDIREHDWTLEVNDILVPYAFFLRGRVGAASTLARHASGLLCAGGPAAWRPPSRLAYAKRPERDCPPRPSFTGRPHATPARAQGGGGAVNNNDEEDSDDDIAIDSVHETFKCPITAAVINHPVRSKTCPGRCYYEKAAIQSAIKVTRAMPPNPTPTPRPRPRLRNAHVPG